MNWKILCFAALAACGPSTDDADGNTDDGATDAVDTDSDGGDTDSDGGETGGGDTDTDPVDLPCPELDPAGFGTPRVVLETPGNAKSPVVWADEAGAVHIAWHDFSEDPSVLYYGTLGTSGWDTHRLDPTDKKEVRPQLLSVGDVLHLVFDVYEEDRQDWAVFHSMLINGNWTTATRLGDGEKADIAWFDGALHAVWFNGSDLIHQSFDGLAWTVGPEITEPEYVQTFRLCLLATQTGLEVIVATSPGNVSYDPEIYSFNGTSWSSSWLFRSNGLSSDDPSGALDNDGVPIWVWTEQDPNDPWTINVVSQRSDENQPSKVNTTAGFSTSPDIVVPADGQAIVAWINDDSGQIEAAREPYTDVNIIGSGSGPQLATDTCGVTHLVFYGYGAPSGAQDVYHTTNAAP